MTRRCARAIISLVAVSAVGASCSAGVSPGREERTAVFAVDRSAAVPGSTASGGYWNPVTRPFLWAAAVGGVSLGCDNFIRTFSGPDGQRQARDAGDVFIHNGTGATMYDVVATIESVVPDVGGVQRITFDKTRFEYSDIADGAGGPGPDGLEVDGTEQRWSYTCDAEATSDEYLGSLQFTVKVTWLADR